MLSSSRIFGLIIFLGLLPWLYIQSRLSLNGDAIWLTTAAERLLAGQAMAQGYFEVNPPLSIFYHFPPVLLDKILPVPLHNILFFYFLGLIALSAFAINQITRHWPFLDKEPRLAMLAAFLAANTIITTIALGQRDQVVILGLLPLLMTQLSLTWGYQLPRRLFWPVMVLGTLAVLIKPHFGLLPALLLLHRAFYQKRFFSLARDPDFLALAGGTLAYIGFIALFFHDYLSVILPDVLALYTGNKDYAAALLPLLIYGFMFIVFPLADIFLTPLQGRAKILLFLLYGGALAGLIPFAVQMKGFYYHLLPALTLFCCAFGLSLYAHAMRLKLSGFRLFAVTAMILGLAYAMQPLPLAYPAHQDYPALPLSPYFADCKKPCPVLIFHSNMEVLHQTVFYNELEHASRFPVFWFLPGLIQQSNEEQSAQYRKKYAAMVAADLEKYRPRLLLIGHFNLPGDKAPFDFATFFSVSEDFRRAWANYRKEDTITVNLRPYFAGTKLDKNMPQKYDIYRRKELSR